MTQALHSSDSLPTQPPRGEESGLWMPPRRMRQYHLVKTLGALLFTGLFVGWLILQWSNPMMRVLASVLALSTGWITFSSIRDDIQRGRGRQLRIAGRSLQVTLPDRQVDLALEQIAGGVWQDEPHEQAGLTLLDPQGRTLVRLDSGFLVDQAEARAFLNWLRRRTQAHFPVRWPVS